MAPLPKRAESQAHADTMSCIEIGTLAARGQPCYSGWEVTLAALYSLPSPRSKKRELESAIVAGSVASRTEKNDVMAISSLPKGFIPVSIEAVARARKVKHFLLPSFKDDSPGSFIWLLSCLLSRCAVPFRRTSKGERRCRVEEIKLGRKQAFVGQQDRGTSPLRHTTNNTQLPVSHSWSLTQYDFPDISNNIILYIIQPAITTAIDVSHSSLLPTRRHARWER